MTMHGQNHIKFPCNHFYEVPPPPPQKKNLYALLVPSFLLCATYYCYSTQVMMGWTE